MAEKSADRFAYYAKRFAAKEAFVKALGTGVAQGVSWQDMEISNLDSGKPTIAISGAAGKILKSLTPKGKSVNIHLSLSDSDTMAQAVVIIECV